MDSDQLRKIDALVAEKVIGWTIKPGQIGTSHSTAGHFIAPEDVPEYSTDIAAAWDVVEAWKGDGSLCEIVLSRCESHVSTGWRARFGESEASWEADAPTAPLAICLAALKAKGVDVDGQVGHPVALPGPAAPTTD